YVSSDFSESGTNIPAESISQDNSVISWDDGNGAFNQYISVLATEYRLLKNGKQDYSSTIKQLYYALRSFERLDRSAESVYRADHSMQNNDLNGFFLRYDVNDTFWNRYRKGGTNPYFEQVQANYDPGMQNSLDNCVHYLESFALVNALVDSETVDGTEIDFKQIARDNAQRIVQNMYHPTEPVPVIDFPLLKKIYSYTWYLKNPITNEFVPVKYGSGLDGTMLYISYGFTKSANRILGAKRFKEMRFSYEIAKFILTYPVTDYSFELNVKQKKGIFPLPGISYKDYSFYMTLAGNRRRVFRWPWFPMFAKTLATQTKTWNIGQDDYLIRSLCATGNIDIVKGRSPYEVLIQKQFESSKLKYEHLPLIWAIVMNNFSYIREKDRTYIKSLLDAAPQGGPYKFLNNGTLDFGQYEWSSPSRLVWPDRLGDVNKPVTGYFNGLDYMFLHNLYLLAGGRY
ncbi:MAG TPA: hypothetical protein VIH57_25825, partial [Bacteroidales bacterium]